MGNIVISDRLRIPSWVGDFTSFRKWIRGGDFPDHGWYSYLKNEIWVDVSMEKLWQNRIKGVIGSWLDQLATQNKLGIYFYDRMFLTNLEAGLSTEPDGMFASQESLDKGRVKLLGGDDTVEVIGSPDMTLEVVSPTSKTKDTEVLRVLYWEAGVQEYWLVQAERNNFVLDILRRGSEGFIASRKSDGWVKSKVFDASFRLLRITREDKLSDFRLEMR